MLAYVLHCSARGSGAYRLVRSMDGAGLQESLRPAPLKLDGIISGRDALSAKKAVATSSKAAAAAAPAVDSKTPPLLAMLLGGLLLWLLPLAYGSLVSSSPCFTCVVISQVGAYFNVALLVLGLIIALLLYGWKRTLDTGVDCCWMQLCGQDANMQILRAVLWLVDEGPGRAAPSNKQMNRAALARSSEMRVERVEPGRIVFAGSSTFSYWNQMAEDWAPLPTLNVAFGGSSTAQVNAHFGRLVKRQSPAVIVYYCGTNDLLAGLPAVACLEGFKHFVALCRAHPETRMCPIVYLGINTTPLHRLYGEVRRTAIFSANQLVHKFVKSEDTTPGGTSGPAVPPEVLAKILPSADAAAGAAATEGADDGLAHAPLFPEVEAPLGSGTSSSTERQDGMATWHAGMVAGAMAVAESLPAPELGGSAGAESVTIDNPALHESVERAGPNGGQQPPVTSQSAHGPLFFVDLDAADWSDDMSMYLGDGHHLNDAGHSALAELLKPIVQPLWRARTR